jgi:hypothetical protein
MGAVIMVGTLVGLIVVIVALVLHFDPEARAPIEPGDPVEAAPPSPRPAGTDGSQGG